MTESTSGDRPDSKSRRIADDEYIRDDAEAQKRYDKWQARDPFPGIQPALLHSGQIRDYILKTGMLSPFTEDDLKKIKPASLEIPFEGRVVYWDENEVKYDQQVVIDSGKYDRPRKFSLRRNSIAFVQVKPKFRLPYYIAIRFNLKITHVYRGLLLGTGPLVDPGYEGDLFIPLHNLTDNEYVFEAGEGLLWMEFTKLQWDDDARSETMTECVPRMPEGYNPFPKRKRWLPLDAFFRKAHDLRSIRSSIPQEIRSAERAAVGAARTVQRFTAALTLGGLIAVFALGMTVLRSHLTTLNLANEVRHEIGGEQVEMRAKLETLSAQLEELRRDLVPPEERQ